EGHSPRDEADPEEGKNNGEFKNVEEEYIYQDQNQEDKKSKTSHFIYSLDRNFIYSLDRNFIYSLDRNFCSENEIASNADTKCKHLKCRILESGKQFGT